jgi:hypothetical protein
MNPNVILRAAIDSVFLSGVGIAMLIVAIRFPSP